MIDEVRANKSITIHVVPVFPFRMNHHQTLFGGLAYQWMDEVAFIAATRYTKKRLVTVGSEKVRFLKPIEMGDFAEVIGKIQKVGKKSITIEVEIYLEKMYEEVRELAVNGLFSFVAVDENGIPVEII